MQITYNCLKSTARGNQRVIWTPRLMAFDPELTTIQAYRRLRTH